jgi:gliding motility-associated lipoprotein GldD
MKIRIFRISALLVVGFLILLVSCRENYTPKPKGYPRIDIPERVYREFDTNFPYSFNYPVYAEIVPHDQSGKEPYWINIVYPQFQGQIHLSYKKINGNLISYLEDSRTFVMKHIPKADEIRDSLIIDRERNVFGMIYFIEGTGAASPCQFFLTDSSTNFVRGALYFDFQPNNDSLAPVIRLIESDIRELVGTLKWKAI